MKTPAQAAAAYVTNGSSAAATTLWGNNFTAAIPTMLDAAVKAIPRWQAAVADPAAAAMMTKGLNRAKNNTGAIATKAKTVGVSSLAAGVRAAGAAGGNYDQFTQKWIPAVSGEVQTLNTTNPRGTRQDNRARQAAYDAWVDQQAGNFRVV
jgi:hypothetical protein